MEKTSTTYRWRGRTRHGYSRNGEIYARSLTEAKYLLRKQGIVASRIQKCSPLFFSNNKKITSVDISVFSRQIATMLSAGVPLIQSLDIIAQGQEKQRVKTTLSDIAHSVKSGNPLSSVLRKHPLYFDNLYCDLVFAGEQSGALETIYDNIATHKEKADALKSKIKKAMFYPIAVLTVAFIVTTILLVFVVPQFEHMFSSFDAELPAFTQFILAISRFLQHNGLFMTIGLAGSGVLFRRIYKKSLYLKDKIDRVKLKVPVIGEILQKASIARFTRTLATTFAAGIPLIDALNSAAGASGNAVYRDAILRVRKDVAGGTPMHATMRATQIFPNMVTQMVAIGEESGAVDEMLNKVATIYEDEVDDMINGLTSLIEPIIMAVLGVVIGGLIIGMYLPVFQMGNVV